MVQKKLHVGKMKLIAQKGQKCTFRPPPPQITIFMGGGVGEPHVAKPSERLFAFFDLSTFSGEPWVTPEDSINKI